MSAQLPMACEHSLMHALLHCIQGFRGTIHEIDSKTAGKSYAINGTVYQVQSRPI